MSLTEGHKYQSRLHVEPQRLNDNVPNTNTKNFTEYTSLSKPCTIRRLSVDHNGMVWYALDSFGKIGMLNPNTGEVVGYYSSTAPSITGT